MKLEKQYTCKICGKKFYTAEGGIFHLLFIEKDKRINWINVLKNLVLTKLLKLIFIGLPILIICGVTFPFWWLNETIRNKMF